MMASICLIIPCFNESVRLKKEAFLNFLNTHGHFAFLFVNDGSTDSTLAIIKEMNSSHRQCHYLHLEKNVGKAEAVRQGFLFLIHRMPSLKWAGFWDADLATPLDEALRFHQIFNERPKALVISGSRILYMGGKIRRNPIRHYLGRIFAIVTRTMLRLPLHDTQCGAKIFDRFLWEILFSRPFVGKWFFDIEIFFRLKQFKKIDMASPYVLEVPLKEWNDVKGSKLKILDFIKTPIELAKIYLHYKC